MKTIIKLPLSNWQYFIIYSLSFFLVASCSDTEESIQETEAVNEIVLQKDFLVFPTEESFENTIKLNSEKTPEDLQQWEATLGFNSMQTFFNKAQYEEELYLSNLYEQGKTLEGHSDFVEQNRAYLAFSEEDEIEINVFWPDVASVVNKSGLVQVGAILYQYSLGHLKAIPVTDLDYSIKVIMGKEQSEALFVSDVDSELVDVLEPADGRTSYDGSCSDRRGSEKITVNVYLRRVTIPIYQTYPCTSSLCGPGNYARRVLDYGCVGTCQVQIGSRYRSTLSAKVSRKIWGIPQSTHMVINATYKWNGVTATPFYRECICSSFSVTIRSEEGTNPSSVTNASIGGGEPYGTQCSVTW